MDNPCESGIFRTISQIHFKLEICFDIIYRTDAIDIGPSTKNKMVAIELVKMCAMDNPCESDILRTISPVYFKLGICFHIIKWTDAIDFGPSAINKMAPIKLFKLYAMDNPFEHDIFRTVYPMDFKHERGRTLLILGHLLKQDGRHQTFYNVCYIDNPCERDIFRIISPIDFKFDL